ncbi:GTP 3',8-cyclase MoaA [Slackia faecicanis]|uniref:GTP 3',8-cyclase n=1 Tax=Slackia faecicanis TaxID=255723 RepID=A0A3N0AGQ4_9ACTN|nr:GTP 3',8-cyclase MoaA [Slackia faecicanis]MDO5359088.1 GTP 3',8-cyclase MoaA [Slackia faecicanis]RNL20911.1 GTP 3',8-cyclase MoaA [Slackia faecicanis]
MKDSHGRTIDYLRISLTDRCNLRCIYCMPEEGVHALSHDDILTLEEIERLVRVAADMGITRVRLTGGEPLVRRGVTGLVRALNDIPGIESVALTTNGILLPRMAGELAEAGLSRVNISLDTLDPEQYGAITRCGSFDDAMAGIDAALEAGFSPVKLNAVVVRSLNQDVLSFARMSIDRPLHVRFIEYMPVGESAGACGCGWGKEDVIPSDELHAMIDEQAEAAGLGRLVPAAKHRPSGWGPARYYEFENAQGTVGFISPLSRHFCSECNRLRLTADGKIRPCLFSDEEFDVRAALRSGGTDDDVRAVLYEALGAKPDEHHDKVGTQRGMSQIGG